MRRHGVLAITTLFVCLVASTSAEETSSIDTHSITALRHSKQELQDLERQKQNLAKGMHVCNFSNAFDGCVPLRTPSGTRNVAIVKVQLNGACELNPIGRFDYGPIPPLNKMTIDVADRLWGISEESKSNTERTYHLVQPHADENFFLDTVFVNGRLERYRFRSTSWIRIDDGDKYVQISPDWHQVPSEIK
jgi:hypothetical protein